MAKVEKEMDREAPHSHLFQALLPVIFLVIWILDSYVFKISTWLNEFIPFVLRLVLFVVVMCLALITMYVSHNNLFHENEPQNKLITDGILGYTRNPLYLGILLIYIAFLFLSVSLINIILFLIVIAIYNWMVGYEEATLEKLFGEEFLNYKKNVPKWIPKFTKKT